MYVTVQEELKYVYVAIRCLPLGSNNKTSKRNMSKP
jgi:hypothetical protein